MKFVHQAEIKTKRRSERAIERCVIGNARVVRFLVIYLDEIAALYSYTIDWRTKMCGEENDRARPTFLNAIESQERELREGWWKTEGDATVGRKGGPVIGIDAIEKPWKINYRSCKRVENYIDRRQMPRGELCWSLSLSSLPVLSCLFLRIFQTALSLANRDCSLDCYFKCVTHIQSYFEWSISFKIRRIRRMRGNK